MKEIENRGIAVRYVKNPEMSEAKDRNIGERSEDISNPEKSEENMTNPEIPAGEKKSKFSQYRKKRRANLRIRHPITPLPFKVYVKNPTVCSRKASPLFLGG